jgi:hypothetical protein
VAVHRRVMQRPCHRPPSSTRWPRKPAPRRTRGGESQIADEARHVRFFNRFYREVGVREADTLQGRLAETSEHVNPEFDELFDEMLK